MHKHDKTTLAIFGLAFLTLLAGCESGTKPTATHTVDSSSGFTAVSDSLGYRALTPVAAGDASAPKTSFEMLSADHTGIDFQNVLNPRHDNKLIETGSGVAIGDYDGDQLPDIYLLSTDAPNRLYRNLGDFKFADVTAEAGVDGKVDGKNAWGAGASFADIDNDGDLDLFVCNMASRNLLYVNQGDGTFIESSKSAGLDFSGASKIGSFCDFDADGDLDMYLLTYLDKEAEGTAKLRYVDGVAEVHPDFVGVYEVVDGHIISAGHPDVLYENNGDGTFTDITTSAGISGYGMGLSVTWFDFDEDNLPDIYIGNDFKQADALYRNNGDGTFTDVIAETVSHTPWFSMGADTGDMNNDGMIDLMIADMSGTTHYKQKVNMGDMADSGWFLTYGAPRQYMRNAVYLNTGVNRFLETAYMSDLESTDWTWAVRLLDLDNDGRLDVYITNGHARNSGDSDYVMEYKKKEKELSKEELREFESKVPPLEEPNLAFRNLGDMQFESVGEKWNLNLKGVSHGVAAADFDQDGDLDLVVNNLSAPASIYRNDSIGGNRLLVELRGTESNAFGFGARVDVWHDGKHQVRRLMPVRGYVSSDEPLLHFGLADSTQIDRLVVTWPNGRQQEVRDLQANRLYRVIEDAAGSSEFTTKGQGDPLFRETARALGLKFDHKEIYFNDYTREPLLPYQLSQLGPGVAWGDVNGDGFPDAFVGGAKLQPGHLFINRNGEKFELAPGPWKEDSIGEDMACLFFDAEGDGDQDLYVVRGSNEFDADNPVLADRLFLNDGQGVFTIAPEGTLPKLTDSGSCVSAVDFDRDGDLDLFVGSRSIPGKYPLTPQSRLLMNENGKFADVTEQVAPNLAKVGLVNSAIWSDYDNDGWTDLILALDWGPVTIFRNEEGKLSDITNKTPLSASRGWWHALAGGDFDGDGDTDYVAMNQGLNSKYHTSDGHPHRLYYADFDGNGTMDLVEAEYEGNAEFPMRGRSCSSNCMPFIAEKFGTFHEFALAEVSDIYDTDEKATPFLEVTELQSVIIWNDGENKFRIQPLPRMAQISPGFGVAASDINGDGHLDIFMTQNFFGPQPETGFMDGGLGWLLSGDGKGNFQLVWPRDSGIVIPGDATGAALADFDRDGDIDSLVATNDGPLMFFKNEQQAQDDAVTMVIEGSPGNRQAVGAQLQVVSNKGTRKLFEIRAGSGYLSQSHASAYLPRVNLSEVESFEVRWPDGSNTQHKPDSNSVVDGAFVIRFDGS